MLCQLAGRVAAVGCWLVCVCCLCGTLSYGGDSDRVEESGGPEGHRTEGGAGQAQPGENGQEVCSCEASL